MDLEKARMIAEIKMTEHGLHEWTFEFDSAVKRRGACNYSKKQISLSESLTLVRTEEAVLNTILHEIAHALVGPFKGHGKEWKKQAILIGCSGARCSEDTHEAIKPAFRGVCPGCQRVVERHRRKNISCGKCSPGVYKVAYRFKWTRQ